MPTNKNASIRYQALDKCFRDKCHRYYIDDLIEKCEEALYYYNGVGGVSRRQIFEDIKFMESDTGWSIPLERHKEGRKVYYRYIKSDFTINAQPLTDDEARQLEAVIMTLSRFRGIPSNEWVDEVISNLEWRFNLKKDNRYVIGFDQNEKLKGIHHLSTLIDAILHQQVLKLTYRSYKEQAEEKVVLIHPYFVKQYNNRWFLMARDHEHGYLSNFALDRIISFEVVNNIEYLPNKDIDFETYFNEVIGVTIPCNDVETMHVVLKLNPKQYSYIVSKPIHPTQQIVDAEQKILSIDVKPNYELDYHILSLGPDVEVIAPEEYRAHIKSKLDECIKKYQ